jgi:4-amino-4-deoxy-L-arabinose transferase-like glycosyltransferase
MKTPFENQIMNTQVSPQKTAVPIVLLVIVILALAFVFQGSRGIWQPDEGYYVGTAVTMIKNGDFLVPRISQGIFLEKPPMLYWGIIAGLDIFGKSEFACRFFTAACFALTAVVTGLLARNIFKNKLNAVIASFIYATMVIPFVAANFITPDTSLVLWTTLSILFFWKTLHAKPSRSNLFKMLMYIVLGFGFLAKGPAVLIPCTGMFVYLILTKQFKKFFLTPWTLLGILLFAVVGLSWYIYISLKVPGAAAYFFDNQIWGRLVTGKYRRNPGITKILIYVPVLLFGSLPWTAIWLERKKYFKTTVMNKNWWISLSQHPVKLFLMTMFFMPLLIISLASSKLPLYCLSIFPLLAVATSKLWADKLYRLPPNQIRRGLTKSAILLSCWVLVLFGSRFGLAQLHNNEKDTRALWTELAPYIPKDDYEIITLEFRADGLLFYGAQKIENVTQKEDPYPTFTMPAILEAKIAEIIGGNHVYLFIMRGEGRFNNTFELLKTHFSNIKTVALEHKRWLIIIDPGKPS